MTAFCWHICPEDVRRSRLRSFPTAMERDRFCSADPLLRIPLEGVGSLPCCRLPEPPPPKVKWISYERRRS
jgi:hypothetical protein